MRARRPLIVSSTYTSDMFHPFLFPPPEENSETKRCQNDDESESDSTIGDDGFLIGPRPTVDEKVEWHHPYSNGGGNGCHGHTGKEMKKVKGFKVNECFIDKLEA